MFCFVKSLVGEEIPADSFHTSPLSVAGDTNDNKTAVGPEDVSKMGCPCLGEHTKLEVVIEESYEFKVSQNKQVYLHPPITLMSVYSEPSHKDDECQDKYILYSILLYNNIENN